jgi:hypothetical protein
MWVSIPRSNPSRSERTYALLVRSARRDVYPFEGRFFRCGARVNEAALRPTPAFPEVPLLIEFAGTDRSGWGHNRSNDIHVLWRYDRRRGLFREVARTKSRGPEWRVDLQAVLERELVAPDLDFAELATEATTRILKVLDRELAELPGDGRVRAMSFLHDEIAARLVA